MTSTISAGTTNNWIMNRAEGCSTGGSKSCAQRRPRGAAYSFVAE